MGEQISYDYLFNLLSREKSKQDLQDIEKSFYKTTLYLLNQKEKKICAQMSQQSLLSDSSFEKEKIQTSSIRKTFTDIINLRQKKVILLALMRSRIESTIINKELFTYEEESFFEDSVRLFRSFKSGLFNQDLSDFKIESQNKINSEELKSSDDTLKDDISTNSEGINKNSTDVDSNKESNLNKISESLESKEELNINENSEMINIKFLSKMSKFYGPKKEIYGPFSEDDEAEIPAIVANILIKKGRAEKYDVKS